MKNIRLLLILIITLSFTTQAVYSADLLKVNLKFGDNPEVKKLQEFLHTLGNSNLLQGKKGEYLGAKVKTFLQKIPTTGIPVGASVVDLKGQYSFDDNANDSTSGGNNGTLFGGAQYSAGKIGKAVQLDGVDDYFSADTVKSKVYDGLNAMTVSYWIKPNAFSGYTLARWGSGRQFSQTFISDRVRMYWRVGGTMGGGTTVDHISATSLPLNTWSHIVIVYENPTSVK